MTVCFMFASMACLLRILAGLNTVLEARPLST